jgi:hypothetical protein
MSLLWTKYLWPIVLPFFFPFIRTKVVCILKRARFCISYLKYPDFMFCNRTLAISGCNIVRLLTDDALTSLQNTQHIWVEGHWIEPYWKKLKLNFNSWTPTKCRVRGEAPWTRPGDVITSWPLGLVTHERRLWETLIETLKPRQCKCNLTDPT